MSNQHEAAVLNAVDRSQYSYKRQSTGGLTDYTPGIPWRPFTNVLVVILQWVEGVCNALKS